MKIDIHPIRHRAAWRADQFSGPNDYAIDLGAEHLREIG